MKTKRIFAAIFAIMLLLSTGCSEEPAAPEIPIKNETVIIDPVVPEEPEESSSSESVLESEPEPEMPVVPESSSSEEVHSSESKEQIVPTPRDKSLLILVNPWNYIPEDYSVALETVQGKYKLDAKAAESARNLVAAAAEAGFNMQLCSAYRTVEKSAELYRNKVNQYLGYGYSEEDAKIEAAKWVAPPGTSEHHTGLAMDLVSSDYWNYYSDLEHDYEKFDSFKWLYEHCDEFGFILRYPKDKQDITGITYEPWHYRYVGIEAATYIMEHKICLEEYLEIIG
ncbi:MAG: M15 family metallopeptidase [Oscillospiraceae bacterium]|nr:M15 family metallopeptidase [Oscillospiraceae bacterium]